MISRWFFSTHSRWDILRILLWLWQKRPCVPASSSQFLLSFHCWKLTILCYRWEGGLPSKSIDSLHFHLQRRSYWSKSNPRHLLTHKRRRFRGRSSSDSERIWTGQWYINEHPTLSRIVRETRATMRSSEEPSGDSTEALLLSNKRLRLVLRLSAGYRLDGNSERAG